VGRGNLHVSRDRIEGVGNRIKGFWSFLNLR
jgi:hypothetical protein